MHYREAGRRMWVAKRARMLPIITGRLYRKTRREEVRILGDEGEMAQLGPRAGEVHARRQTCCAYEIRIYQ